jgi:hypothetical protein
VEAIPENTAFPQAQARTAPIAATSNRILRVMARHNTAPTPTGFAEIVSVIAIRNAVSNAIGHAKFFSWLHNAVVRVYDETGNVIETHEHTGDFQE